MKRIFRSLLVFACLLIGVQHAYGCQCVPPRKPFKISRAVFFGQLIEIAYADERSPRTLKFRVERYWKGIREEYVSILTTSLAPCGYDFRVNEKYLIYAGEENGEFETGPCRILRANVAEGDLKKLGKGKIPEPGTINIRVSPNSSFNADASRAPLSSLSCYLMLNALCSLRFDASVRRFLYKIQYG